MEPGSWATRGVAKDDRGTGAEHKLPRKTLSAPPAPTRQHADPTPGSGVTGVAQRLKQA